MDVYHVLNRGVDKRAVVIDNEDRLRFMHDLLLMNDKNYVPNYQQKKRYAIAIQEKVRGREPLVYMYAFCLMDNHYHMLLSPIDNDIKNLSLFMKKFNMGYAKYFNEKYKRQGALWQGKYKKIHIHRDGHFLWMPYYIHLNPLDMFAPEWREGAVKDYEACINFLQKYRWSSHLDYWGVKNYPSILEKEFLAEESLLGNSAQYRARIKGVLMSEGYGWDSLDTLEKETIGHRMSNSG